jgi:hypothetical protein
MPAALLVLGAVSLAAAQTASTTYRGTQQDPFTKYKPQLKRVAGKNGTMPLAAPPIGARIDNYRAQKISAMNLRRPVPKPTTALLLSEIQVTGIFRTPRGVAATVEAMPIKLSYVIYPGEVFYDGMLVAIEENQLIFRRDTRWADGRRGTVVETKPLRQPNAYTDSLTTQKSDSDGAVKSDATVGSMEATEKQALGTNPNMKAVESLNSKVDKLLEFLKKQQ